MFQPLSVSEFLAGRKIGRLVSHSFEIITADIFKVSPEPPNAKVEKGYLTLVPEFIKANNTFELDIPLKPRLITPHPNTNQDIIALARGPIIYCLEDVDNPWVDNHFKTLRLDPTGIIEERAITSSVSLSEPYIGLTMHDAACFAMTDGIAAPGLPVDSVVHRKREDVNELHFIPYALRANRDGKGHMRVGIRRRL